MATAVTTTAPPKFEAMFRFPTLSRRWKSVGVFDTEAEATAALELFLKGRTYKVIDKWIHRIDPDAPKKRIRRETETTDPETAA